MTRCACRVSTRMISPNSFPPSKLAPDLYLPSNAQTLLAALASALSTDHPAHIVYLDSGTPLPVNIADAIRRAFPQFGLEARSDVTAIEEFATLPPCFPAILRRNLAILPGGRFARPQDRPPNWLNPIYRNGYVYLTGNFTAKALRGRCQEIILREEGLANYHTLPFSTPKALVRFLSGKSLRRQIMGEESWVDRIELAHPEDLPPALQRKALRLTFAGLMNRISDTQAKALARLFWQGPLPELGARTALLLSQPLEQSGFCHFDEKEEIYAKIASFLSSAGYSVVRKQHPRENILPALNVANIPAFFPIEAWPWLVEGRFDLAVGLCTSALGENGALFSKAQLQLVHPREFRLRRLNGWHDALRAYFADFE